MSRIFLGISFRGSIDSYLNCATSSVSTYKLALFMRLKYDKQSTEEKFHLFSIINACDNKMNTPQAIFSWIDNMRQHFSDFHFGHCIFPKIVTVLRKLCENDSEAYRQVNDYFDINPNFLDDFFKHSQENMTSFSAQELCNIIVGLASLKIRPPENWVNVWFSCTESNMFLFSETDLVQIIRSMQMLNIIPQKKWMLLFFEISQPILMMLDILLFSTISFSLIGLKSEIPDSWACEWLKVSQYYLESTTDPKQLIKSLQVLKQMRVSNPRWIETWFVAYLALMDKSTLEDLSEANELLGYVGAKLPNGWLELCEKIFVSCENIWTMEIIAKTLHGFAMLQVNQDDMPCFFQHVKSFLNSQTLSISLGGTVCYKALLSTRYYKSIGLDLGLKTEELLKIEEAIQSTSDSRVSRSQARVFDMYKASHEDVLEEVWIPEILSHVDLYIPTHKRIVEVDGIHHYRDNRLNTKTTLQSHLLRSQGYDLVRIPVTAAMS